MQMERVNHDMLTPAHSIGGQPQEHEAGIIILAAALKINLLRSSGKHHLGPTKLQTPVFMMVACQDVAERRLLLNARAVNERMRLCWRSSSFHPLNRSVENQQRKRRALNFAIYAQVLQWIALLTGYHTYTTNPHPRAAHIENHRLQGSRRGLALRLPFSRRRGLRPEIVPGAQAGVTELRSDERLRIRWRIMHTTQSKSANTSLAQLGQARRDKTAILLIRTNCIEKIARLDKQINPLADCKIGRLLERIA